jgi:uncharacterized membrane protein YidH (DUF202 family)
MKAKHTIILIALGFAIGYMATFFHRSEASVFVSIGAILKIIGVLGLAYKVVSYEGFRKFMNK